MNTRLLILKLTATLAAMVASGCSMPSIDLPSKPPTTPQQVEVRITVDDGKITVNDAKIDVKATSGAAPSAAPCSCGCAKEGCACLDSKASAAPRASSQGLKPQVIKPPRMVYECRGGVCGWYSVEEPATVIPSKAAAESQSVTVYLGNDPASRAMRASIGEAGISYVTGTPPAIGGLHWWPTAVKPTGETWTPGRNGWHSGSATQFRDWLGQ